MPVDDLIVTEDQLEIAETLLEAAEKTPFVTVLFLNLRDRGICDGCLGKRNPESLIQRVSLGEDLAAMVVSYICRRCART